jgi:hypothetical protein
MISVDEATCFLSALVQAVSLCRVPNICGSKRPKCALEMYSSVLSATKVRT